MILIPRIPLLAVRSLGSLSVALRLAPCGPLWLSVVLCSFLWFSVGPWRGLGNTHSNASALFELWRRGSFPLPSFCPEAHRKKSDGLFEVGRTKTFVDHDRAFQNMAKCKFPIAKLVPNSRLQNSDDLFDVEACGYACERGAYKDTSVATALSTLL